MPNKPVVNAVHFTVNVNKDGSANLASLPPDCGVIFKNLPSELKKRDASVVKAFAGRRPAPGKYLVTIKKTAAGKFIIGQASRGIRKENAVLKMDKLVINRNTGEGVRFCFIPDAWKGKRVSVRLSAQK